jgi:hypothetical protein
MSQVWLSSNVSVVYTPAIHTHHVMAAGELCAAPNVIALPAPGVHASEDHTTLIIGVFDFAVCWMRDDPLCDNSVMVGSLRGVLVKLTHIHQCRIGIMV